MTRVLTHGQYEELVGYEDERPKWRFRPPSKSLTRSGFLAVVPKSGHDRASSFFRITGFGHKALAAYRARYGIPAVRVPGEAGDQP